MQQFAQSYFMDMKIGHCVRKVVVRVQCVYHRCLRSIAPVCWEHRISNAELRLVLFVILNARSIDELMTLRKLHRLSHILLMPFRRLLRKANIALHPKPARNAL